jgi:hypothetical protein
LLLPPLPWSPALVVHATATAVITAIVAGHPVDWLHPTPIAAADLANAAFLKEHKMAVRELGAAMTAIMVITVVVGCQGPRCPHYVKLCKTTM